MTKKFFRSFGGTILTVFAVLFIASFVTACGGGGGGGGGNTVVIPPPTPPTDYSCDSVKELAAAPRTIPYQNPPPLPGLVFLPQTIERWSLDVAGEPNQLNVAITVPPKGVPVVGVVINGHGHSDLNATLPTSEIADRYWDTKMSSLGYTSVTVARRGNFGSTGVMYPSANFSSASSLLNYWKYQAASVVSVVDKMANDAAYKNYMGTIVLAGFSGGSDTVTQTAADSLVFRAATKKALIRFHSGIIFSIATPSTISAVDEYATLISKSAIPSFWVTGDMDTTTSPGQVACQYKFFNQTSGYDNNFYLVPGMAHYPVGNVFGEALIQNFRQYMTTRGFTGF